MMFIMNTTQFIGNFDIFYLILQSYIFSIKYLTLILTIVGQCDSRYIMTLPIKQQRHFSMSRHTLSLIFLLVLSHSLRY
jgi:hypothetical protein